MYCCQSTESIRWTTRNGNVSNLTVDQWQQWQIVVVVWVIVLSCFACASFLLHVTCDDVKFESGLTRLWACTCFKRIVCLSCCSRFSFGQTRWCENSARPRLFDRYTGENETPIDRMSCMFWRRRMPQFICCVCLCLFAFLYTDWFYLFIRLIVGRVGCDVGRIEAVFHGSLWR